MAVNRIAEVSRYVGLSTDTKPTPPAGSTFFETDTGYRYVYDGSWQLLAMAGSDLPPSWMGVELAVGGTS